MQNRETLKARGSVDDHVPFIKARQGFSRPTTESSQITGTAAQAFYKKGGNIQKKQEGVPSEACGGKVKKKLIKKK